MRPATQPLHLLLATLAGWMNSHQQRVLQYLVEENRVLKEQLGGRRLRLSDDQRRRLAAKGKRLGRAALERVATLVTPDTIMRWHHRLIAAKWADRWDEKASLLAEVPFGPQDPARARGPRGG